MSDPNNAASLMLFVTGDSPRSQRARANLAEELNRLGQDQGKVREIDLIESPESTINYGIFATPALLRMGSDNRPAVLYGDLSDSAALHRFLVEFSSA